MEVGNDRPQGRRACTAGKFSFGNSSSLHQRFLSFRSGSGCFLFERPTRIGRVATPRETEVARAAEVFGGPCSDDGPRGSSTERNGSGGGRARLGVRSAPRRRHDGPTLPRRVAGRVENHGRGVGTFGTRENRNPSENRFQDARRRQGGLLGMAAKSTCIVGAMIMF